MALTDNEMAAVLLAKEEHKQILNEQSDWIAGAQEATDRIRDFTDPPALRRMREVQEQLMAIADPPFVREMREAQERLRDMIDPPALRQWREEHERMQQLSVGALDELQPAIDRGIFEIDAAKHLAVRYLADMPVDHLAGLKELMAAETLSASIAKSLMVHDTEIEALRRSSALFARVEMPAYVKDLEQLSSMSFAAQTMMADIEAAHGFADRIGMNDVTRSLMEYETGRLNRAYAGFSASVVNRPEWLATAPEFVRTAPGDMIFAQARFVRAVTTHEERKDDTAADEIWSDVQLQTIGYIEAVLPELNPNLMKSWEGAWDTARRRGADWTRHSASSLRHLLIEVLTAVAPPDQIDRAELPKEYVKNGEILRLGQIHWLCSPLKNRSYVRVVRADLDSAMTIVTAMNEAVHEDDHEELEDAFRTMAVRAAVALCNLLKLWKSRR